MKILGQYNYCIISGIPGIGKTTLAQVLTTWFMDQGYELIAARENVQEAIDSFHADKKQVIYFDDFLGRSSLGEALGKNEDEGILCLLKAARESLNKRVIFTTREYILEQARENFEKLSGKELEIAKCILDLESYTRAHRARILYNHVYFSNLLARTSRLCSPIALTWTSLITRITAHASLNG